MATDTFCADKVLAELQGNILRAYGTKYRAVRHLVLRVDDRVAARHALARMVDGDRGTPQVTSGDDWPRKEEFRWCLNVGFTYPGLQAIGVSDARLATFPTDFREGMAARADRLGDVGCSAPDRWVRGLADPNQAHLVVTIHGWEASDIEPISDQVLQAGGGRAFSLATDEPFDGKTLVSPRAPERRIVHFGYADGISQPRFHGVHDPEDYRDELPFAPIGTVLIGYPSSIPHLTWTVPQPDVLGRNGTFNAFRILGQDVAAFEGLLTQQADDLGVDRELVAAKLCGRWRSGVPLSLAPTAADEAAFSDDTKMNEFDYEDDPDGAVCPIGSHIRRTNPRAAHIVQRNSNRSRALIRRSLPYGPPWDPAAPDTPRGLLGNFICASLAAQFESLQYDWVNLGFQDPRITGTNDPLIGANDPATSRFTWPRDGKEPLVIGGFPRFVFTRGGVYTFLPTTRALSWIATQQE